MYNYKQLFKYDSIITFMLLLDSIWRWFWSNQFECPICRLDFAKFKLKIPLLHTGRWKNKRFSIIIRAYYLHLSERYYKFVL